MNDDDGKATKRDRPGDREVSQRQARENAEAARDTRRSDEPGVDDDSDIIESLVGTLGAPVEGALEEVQERERYAQRGEDLGPDQVGGVTGQRTQDIPHYGRKSTVPTQPSDAEAEPKNVAEDATRDRPGARSRR
jgi:hypothetical protein